MWNSSEPLCNNGSCASSLAYTSIYIRMCDTRAKVKRRTLYCLLQMSESITQLGVMHHSCHKAYTLGNSGNSATVTSPLALSWWSLMRSVSLHVNRRTQTSQSTRLFSLHDSSYSQVKVPSRCRALTKPASKSSARALRPEVDGE